MTGQAILLAATFCLWGLEGVPPGADGLANSIWAALVAGFAAFSASQVAHTRDL